MHAEIQILPSFQPLDHSEYSPWANSLCKMIPLVLGIISEKCQSRKRGFLVFIFTAIVQEPFQEPDTTLISDSVTVVSYAHTPCSVVSGKRSGIMMSINQL